MVSVPADPCGATAFPSGRGARHFVGYGMDRWATGSIGERSGEGNGVTRMSSLL
jgi:hypothetical protein